MIILSTENECSLKPGMAAQAGKPSSAQQTETGGSTVPGPHSKTLSQEHKTKGWRENFLAVKKRTQLFLQSSWDQFKAPTSGDWQLPVIRVPSDLMSSCGLCGHQVCMWYSYIHIGTYTYV